MCIRDSPLRGVPQDKVGEALRNVLRRVGGGVVGDEIRLVPEVKAIAVRIGQAVMQVVRPEGVVEVIQIGAGPGDHALLAVPGAALRSAVVRLGVVEGEVVGILVEDGFGTVSYTHLMEPSAEELLLRDIEQAGQEANCAVLMAKIKSCLSTTQFRRLWMHYAEGKSVTEIAAIEGLSLIHICL